MTEGSLTTSVPALEVVYCGVCSFPPEFCEFGGTTKQCEDWLKKHDTPLHSKLYSEEALAANLTNLSVAGKERAQKDAAKKAAKASAAASREAEKRAVTKVLIKRVERNKRKFVTAVQGLEAFGLDLKKVSKEFGRKFATGSSVTKIPGGGEEITVQGDVSAEIEEYILDTYPDVPEDNIGLVEDKKKKAAS